MIELIAVATITILAVVSPGADFAMVTRNSILHGRAAGLLSSLGIACGVQLHVFYTMVGVGLLIRSSPQLFFGIKLFGAIYLIYVGYKTFASTPAEDRGISDANVAQVGMRPQDAFQNGFFTNALNPKTTLFVLSVYTQVVSPETPVGIQFLYGLFMSFAHWTWFSLVAFFLSEKRLRAQLLTHQGLVNRVIGVLLVGLGVGLSLSPSSHF